MGGKLTPIRPDDVTRGGVFIRSNMAGDTGNAFLLQFRIKIGICSLYRSKNVIVRKVGDDELSLVLDRSMAVQTQPFG